MAFAFDFELASIEDKTRLARVLNHIQLVAHSYHGTGGCSAFQIAIELARCLVLSFTLSFRGSSPTVQAATELVIYCHALVTTYHEDGLVSMHASNYAPDLPCWMLFFEIASKYGPEHPNPAVACELPTTMLAKLAYIKPQIDHAGSDSVAFESLCHRFASIQLDALKAGVRRDPALLACSILESSQTTVYKPSEDAANCALHVATFLAHSLREHSITFGFSTLSMALGKVLASCAFWNALAVDHAFCTAFMQQYLPSFAQLTPVATPMADRTAIEFVNLVHYCALKWQPAADDVPPRLALELQDKGEHTAIEHVLDSLLKGYPDAPGAPFKVLEAVAIREIPDLTDPCLTPHEYYRVLVRRENQQMALLHGRKFSIHITTWAGAPPVNLNPPACPLTPAEIICYFPMTMTIPCIWKWISGHGWTAITIANMFNRARDLTGIRAVDRSMMHNWRGKANTAFQKDKNLRAPPQTPRLEITPYVQAYCNPQTRSHPKEMLDMSMSRLVLSVMHHPVGGDAGYFTTMAKHAKLHGDLNGKVLVKHIRPLDSANNGECHVVGQSMDNQAGRNDKMIWRK